MSQQTTKHELTDSELDRIASGFQLIEKRVQFGGPRLASLDLQSMSQKQQQSMQMTSHISNMLYDTAMSVIRKIGG